MLRGRGFAQVTMEQAPQPFVHDQMVSFEEDHTDPTGAKLTIKRSQAIPREHIEKLKRDKIDPDHSRFGDFVRFASIPTGVVEQWDREGFKIEEASAAQIVARLQKDGLDAFITTNRKVWK